MNEACHTYEWVMSHTWMRRKCDGWDETRAVHFYTRFYNFKFVRETTDLNLTWPIQTWHMTHLSAPFVAVYFYTRFYNLKFVRDMTHLYLTWTIQTCHMTHLNAPFVAVYFYTLFYNFQFVRDMIHLTWPIQTWHMTHLSAPFVAVHFYTCFYNFKFVCDMTHLYLTWPIQMTYDSFECALPCSLFFKVASTIISHVISVFHVWYDPPMCDMTHSNAPFVAVCDSVWQCFTVCYRVLQCIRVCCSSILRCSPLLHSLLQFPIR